MNLISFRQRCLTTLSVCGQYRRTKERRGSADCRTPTDDNAVRRWSPWAPATPRSPRPVRSGHVRTSRRSGPAATSDPFRFPSGDPLMRPPGIKDVAAQSGVSIKTVSRVVNGEPSVHPETRSRVLEAIDRLGYVPNTAARSLKSGTGGAIGVPHRLARRPVLRLARERHRGPARSTRASASSSRAPGSTRGASATS